MNYSIEVEVTVKSAVGSQRRTTITYMEEANIVATGASLAEQVLSFVERATRQVLYTKEPENIQLNIALKQQLPEKALVTNGPDLE